MSLQIFRHRVNTIAELQSTRPAYGVEIDLRSRGSSLILAHDPFVDGVRFEDWLEHFHHRSIILNIKEEGLESEILRLVAAAGVPDFFFLDQSFPFLLKTSRGGERRSAVRVSEYESVETALAMAPLVDWVWVDTFTHLALTGEQACNLRAAGLKLCLVSPELVGRTGSEQIRSIQEELRAKAIAIDGVCTKIPELWDI